jgi:hypothetical protein
MQFVGLSAVCSYRSNKSVRESISRCERIAGETGVPPMSMHSSPAFGVEARKTLGKHPIREATGCE